MIIDNKLDKSFGPAGSFTGWVITFFGLIGATSRFYDIISIIVGLAVIAFGLFLAISRSGIRVDTDYNRFKYYTKLFGFIKAGKWNDLSAMKQITVLKNRKVYTAHSRTNRKTEFKQKGYFVYMTETNQRKKVPLKKCKTLDEAKAAATELSTGLDMPVVFAQ